ncbi:MAG: hypothetical protein ACXWW5_01265 [Actinomycetota bacterium]
MPGLERVPADVRTVHLDTFTAAHAATIVRQLDARGIVWWSKEPGFLSRLWEFGEIHLFVDRAKVEEAREVANEVLARDAPRPGPEPR